MPGESPTRDARGWMLTLVHAGDHRSGIWTAPGDRDVPTRRLPEVYCETSRGERNAKVAADGREALQKLKTMEHPCLILLDMMMPGMSGPEFLQQLKAEEKDTILSIPIMVMSAARDAEKAAESHRLAGFIKKPVQLEDLVKAVANHCAG